MFKSIHSFLAMGLAVMEDRNSVYDMPRHVPHHEPGRLRAARAKREAQQMQAAAAARRKAKFVARYNANPMNFVSGRIARDILQDGGSQQSMQMKAAAYILDFNRYPDDPGQKINWPVPGCKLPTHLQGL